MTAGPVVRITDRDIRGVDARPRALPGDRHDEQVADSADVQAVVRALEEQYDAFVAGRGKLLPDRRSLPTGHELGAELERFLAERPKPGDG